MTVFRPSAIATAVASASFLLVPGLSQAQGQLEEVIVTAQKREQSMQDVPVAVSAFSAQQLEKSGVKDLYDLQVNAPSLRVNASQTSTTTTFAIRGVFTSSQNFGLEPSVGLYVDGVYRARQGSMINNLVDLSSIEVLRGPQGTLFGRNTPAGAITMSTNGPDFEGSGFIEGTAGDYDLFGLSGAKSFTAIEDVLALRLTGFGMQRDGYLDIAGGDKEAVNDRDRWGARFQALYLPTDAVTVRLIADYSEVDEKCCGAGSFKNNFFAQNLPPGSDPVLGTDTNIVRIGGTVIDQDEFHDNVISVARAPISRNEDSGVSLQVDWELDSFTLTSITAYRQHDSYDDSDIVFNDLDGAYRINDAEQNQFTQELRISSETDSYSYVAGLYYYNQELDNYRDTTVGDDLSAMLALPPNAFIGGDGARDVNTQDHTSYAVFGQFDYNISESLILTAGLRWTYEDKELENVFTDDAPESLDFSQPNWGFYFFAPLTPQPDVSESFDDDRITGTLKLTWFMDDDTMFYASYGTGYKSGGINADRIAPQFPVVFDPETSESYEVGMKADFPEQAMRLNVALHRTDTDDLQTISFQGGGFTLSNAGVAETYGAEVDLFWAATDSTTLSLGYAYNHGEYTDFENGPCWTGTPWHNGEQPPGLNEDGSCDISGGALSNNAENVVVVTANQDFQLSDTISGFVYGEYSWVDERMTDVNNDPVKLQDAYDLLNLRAGMVFEPYDTYLTLWVRNALDEEYTNTVADAPAQTGRFIGYYEEPRTWGVTLRKDF